MTPEPKPGCDVLVVSPHTDDAEIGLGGTIALLAEQGRSVWLADLTRGELGSNATPDERWAEAAAASALLGVAGRCQLDLPDGFVSGHDRAQVTAVVGLIKRLRPRWIITAPDAVRHPDHRQTPALVERAVFLARLASLAADVTPSAIWPDGAALPDATDRWQVEAVWQTAADHEQPSVLFDVSATWATKCDALACYASQFTREPGRRPTMINSEDFLEKIERRGRTWGRQAGVRYAEALVTGQAQVLTDLPETRWSR